jgi:hypothetical protein
VRWFCQSHLITITDTLLYLHIWLTFLSLRTESRLMKSPCCLGMCSACLRPYLKIFISFASFSQNLLTLLCHTFKLSTVSTVGRDSSVGIATRYGLDGLGIESQWGRDFQHPSRLALVSTQPPVQWVPGHSGGGGG